ncbi:hypothetical protein ACROYT_G038260 [Oculina patagonica]
MYLGHSIDVHDRIQQHRYGEQKIDGFIKRNYRRNGGKDLRVKWIQDPHHKYTEGKFIRNSSAQEALTVNPVKSREVGFLIKQVCLVPTKWFQTFVSGCCKKNGDHTIWKTSPI